MPEYQDDLWDEIPSQAYIVLGTRGRERISLRDCMIPTCGSSDSSKLHPIKKEIETNTNGDVKRELSKYLIHCDTCNADFSLVLERHYNGTELMHERAFATDASGKENYGEIGWIQQ